MSTLSEMMSDPHNAARPPRSSLLRSTAALLCAAALLAVFAFGVHYVADNWREIIYGQTVHTVNPEDGFPVVGNDMSRMHGVSPWLASNENLA